MDREFASSLDVPMMARRALMSPAHFSRQFKAAYGETPYGYLISRRIERAMTLLRGGSTVTEACCAGLQLARLLQRAVHGADGRITEQLPVT